MIICIVVVMLMLMTTTEDTIDAIPTTSTTTKATNDNEHAGLVFALGLAVVAYLEYQAVHEKLWIFFVWLLYNLVWLALVLTALQAALVRDAVRQWLCVGNSTPPKSTKKIATDGFCC